MPSTSFGSKVEQLASCKPSSGATTMQDPLKQPSNGSLAHSSATPPPVQNRFKRKRKAKPKKVTITLANGQTVKVREDYLRAQERYERFRSTLY